MLVKSFKTTDWLDTKSGIPHIMLLPIGIVGFVKCIDGTIRKCKLVSIESAIKYYKSSYLRGKGDWYKIGDHNDYVHKNYGCDCAEDTWAYNWKVAGYAELKQGCGATIINVGTIYATEKDAQFGVSNILDDYNSMNVKYITNFETEYGHAIASSIVGCQLFTGARTYFQIYGYYCNKEGKLCHNYVPSSIVIDKDGVHFISPSFATHALYKSQSEALSSHKHVAVIDFDDEDDDAEVVVKKVKITIEVEETKVEKVNDFIKNL